MNRRRLFRAAITGALLGAARCLPMPRAPDVPANNTTVWVISWTHRTVDSRFQS